MTTKSMIVVHAGDVVPTTVMKSIFLAGPSPRKPGHYNWREEALQLLETLGYDGVIFLPIPRSGKWDDKYWSYEDQLKWEDACLEMADLVLFWIPRDCENLPGFTTNVEFGMWKDSGKIVLGFPPSAEKVRYLQHHAELENIPLFSDLKETLAFAIDRLGEGSLRTGGERFVPLHIWKLEHFQNWYKQLIIAGNFLSKAKLLWSFRVGPKRDFTFAFSLHVEIYIKAEERYKTNEFVISRPDIATIVAYQPMTDIRETKIALIKEFRSPARTADGFIREIPGGSSWKANEDPFETIAHELKEETGLEVLNNKRFRIVGSRQVAGTLSAHVAHTFAIELTNKEFSFLKKQEKDRTVHGVEEDTERTYVEIHKLSDLLNVENNSVDWSMLGMILTALNQ